MATAVTLNQPNSGVVETKGYPELYDRSFDEIKKIAERVLRQGNEFFAERTTNLEDYKEGDVSSVFDLPWKNTDSDRIPLFTPLRGFNKSYTIVQTRCGVIVTETAVTAQKHREINNMLTGLANVPLRKEEYAMADIFNSGFDTHTCADGMYVFDTARPKEDPSAANWANTPTSGSAFSSTSFFTLWQHFQNWTNEKGFVDRQMLQKVVYPAGIHDVVFKVLQSERTPETALNEKNPWSGQATPMLYNYLTDTNAWFGMGDFPDVGFLKIWRVRPNFKPLTDGMNPDLVFGRRLKMAFVVGAQHSKHIYGDPGAS